MTSSYFRIFFSESPIRRPLCSPGGGSGEDRRGCSLLQTSCSLGIYSSGEVALSFKTTAVQVQPVSYKRYFRCNNCFLLLVYSIHLSLSTNLVDPPPLRTIYMKHPLYIVQGRLISPSNLLQSRYI